MPFFRHFCVSKVITTAHAYADKYRFLPESNSRCAGFKKVVWMLQMMCCARWLFARRCKLEENLHQNVVFLALLLRWKNFPDHKLLVLLRIWRSLATVWHFFRYSSTLISPSRSSTPSIVVVWCSPTLRRTFCGKTPLALQNVLKADMSTEDASG